MDELNYIEAILLGIVQGLTEFLPISSSGHLVIAQELLSLQQDSPRMLAFDVVSHVGTLAAVMVVFARPVLRLFGNRAHALRVVGLAGVACVATVVLALPFKDDFERLFTRLPVVALGLAVSGVLLFVTERLPRPRKGWRRFGWVAAAVVGAAQAVAITPGISRSGATICTAMILGLRRKWAAQFSFLIAAPAIAGVTVLKLKDLFDAPSEHNASHGLGPIVVGGLVAGVVGYFALRLLLRLVQQSRLHWFSYYLWVLAAALVVMQLSRGPASGGSLSG